MPNKNPNTIKMVEYKRRESITKRKKVLSTLEEMELKGILVSKAEICRRSGVSKTFLYAYTEELLKPIDDAISRQTNKTKAEKPKYTDKSKDKVIDALKRKIEGLESKNKKLKEENEVLLGKLANRK